ncbi:hypothetical protein QQF64_011254 [Cirrhinus molitorella]|uniref:CCHC-type domain-containing protein n=1 Tax=Cirrhinus molitorella TaxID=172907 RepID=A0ABR3M0B2_9TELE
MEVVQKESVKIVTALLVNAPVSILEDEGVLDLLKRHGSIARVIPIHNPESKYHDHTIVEYNSGSAIESISPSLPLSYTSKENPSLTYQIRALSSVYSWEESSDVTTSYISTLKNIAKLTGKSFNALLREELSQISSSLIQDEVDEEEEAPVELSSTNEQSAFKKDSQSPSSIPNEPALDHDDLPRSDRRLSGTMSHVQLNPSEVQKNIVEHISEVKSEVASAIPSTAVVKLRPFSGRIPQPSNESDYDTWRCNVKLLLDDPSVSDLQRVRRIMESLLPPATDIVKSLGPRASPRAYLNMLDSAYGAIEDGDELFSKFMNTLQNDREKASSYLQRLQVALSKAVRGGGIKSSETNHQLLRQFCRGCWDDVLISELRLDTHKDDPIEFQDLLHSIRAKEDKSAQKLLRMKSHIGGSKHKQQPTFRSAHAYSQDTAIPSKKKQIAELKEQLTSLTLPKPRKTVNPKHKTVPSSTTVEFVAKQPVKSTGGPVTKCRPRPGYCFKCSEDGHISVVCEKPPNSKLVEKKRDELRLKQQEWDRENCHVSGANVQPVPYKGYIEIPITFPEEVVGSEIEISTLALIIPDFNPGRQSQVLIGTNTLDSLYAECSESNGLEPYSPQYGYNAVLKTLELRHNLNSNGCLGLVRLQSKEPLIVPAKQTVALCGKASISCLPVKESVLLEPPLTFSLPGAFLFPSSLVHVASIPQQRWTIQLKNETNRDVVLQPNAVVAEVHAIEHILPCECETRSMPSSQCSSKSVITFDFADSPLSQEWKDRVSKKLNDMSDVFAQHDLDFGRTSKVKHRIKLSDETPFKQRARPIHPHDLAAVRRHLQELKQSGVTLEESLNLLFHPRL